MFASPMLDRRDFLRTAAGTAALGILGGQGAAPPPKAAARKSRPSSPSSPTAATPTAFWRTSSNRTISTAK